MVCQATDIMSKKVGICLLLLVVPLIFLNIYVALLPRDIDNNMQIMQGALYGDQPRMIQAQVNNNNKQGKDIHTFLSDLSSASATTTVNKNGTCRFCNVSSAATRWKCLAMQDLHPFTNIISHDPKEQKHSNQFASKMPHIIHINSKTKCVTNHIENYIKNWRMPYYSIMLHDDEEMNNLFDMSIVTNTFPTLKNATRCLPYQGVTSTASKNDLFRFLLYYYVGGIYTEYDLMPSPRGNFPTTVELFENYLSVSGKDVKGSGMLLLKPDGSPFLGTMFFTSNHPIFYICVDLTLRNLLRLTNVSNQRAFGVTGPPILHEALQIFAGMTKENGERWQSGTYVMDESVKEMYPNLSNNNNDEGNYTILIPEHITFYDYVFEGDREMIQQKRRYYKIAGLKHWQRDDKGVHEFSGSCADYLNRIRIID